MVRKTKSNSEYVTSGYLILVTFSDYPFESITFYPREDALLSAQSEGIRVLPCRFLQRPGSWRLLRPARQLLSSPRLWTCKCASRIRTSPIRLGGIHIDVHQIEQATRLVRRKRGLICCLCRQRYEYRGFWTERFDCFRPSESWWDDVRQQSRSGSRLVENRRKIYHET